MSDTDAGAAQEGLSYAYKPSLLGAPYMFRLAEDGMDWAAGGASGHIPYASVRRVRLSFKPATMQNKRFLTEIWADGAPRLTIASASWKSVVQQERLDRPYSSFIAELHRRIRAAGAPVQLERGAHAIVYWPGLVAYAGVGLGLAILVVRALQSGVVQGAVVVGAFLALFVWQGSHFFRRNRPGRYRAAALPADLLP